MNEKTADKDLEMWIVIQEGGSLSEVYASSYNTEQEACNAIFGHWNASYNTYGPYQVPPALVSALRAASPEAEVSLLDLIFMIASEAAVHQYTEACIDDNS